MCTGSSGTPDAKPPLPGGEAGFTLLEVTLTLAVIALGLAIAWPRLIPGAMDARLLHTSEDLVWQMRVAQAVAQAQSETSEVDLNKYVGVYHVYWGPALVRVGWFDPGVQYQDGYLQMQTGRVSYNAAGDSQTGGVVRLQAGAREQDIHLYLGSGLQWLEDPP
ncbi:pilus assembly FimT family protein [Alicyclobacillus macrosporangiidus]|nr:prepilin-type N-terminal cleavage/methylation domain-containing protein [Alicyclobacillus macrosporangiidus]